MYPHRIRLRGPWECEPLDRVAPVPTRVIMPCRWLDAGLAGYRGRVRFVRKFGYPGNADPATEHLWLTCDGVSGCVAVRLNERVLTDAPCTSFAFDVTQMLSARNRLEITIAGETEAEGIWGEVALEIRKDAYLADVTPKRDGTTLVITGRVVGAAPQPLELYTLVDGQNVDYRTIMPTAVGESFRIELPQVGATAQSVRLDLIHISTIWYAVEMPIPPWILA
jgi:hypothetical protein